MDDLLERCERLLFDELSSDLVLVVHSKDGSNTEIIPAHKLILMTGSDCFKSMFTGNIANESNEQDIHGVEPIAMRTLLNYWQELLNDENVSPTYQVAKMYSVPKLEETCRQLVLGNQDIWAVLTYADLHNAAADWFMKITSKTRFPESFRKANCPLSRATFVPQRVVMLEFTTQCGTGQPRNAYEMVSKEKK